MLTFYHAVQQTLPNMLHHVRPSSVKHGGVVPHIGMHLTSARTAAEGDDPLRQDAWLHAHVLGKEGELSPC